MQQGLTKAVETPAGMLDGKDNGLKRLTANDIINHVLKHKELAELEQRLASLEDSLSDRAWRLLRNPDRIGTPRPNERSVNGSGTRIIERT